MAFIERIYYRLRDLFSKPQERGESSAGYWQNKVRENVLALCVGRRGRLLEVGCGEGLFLSHWVKAHPDSEAFGVDVSDEMLKRAEAIFIKRGVKGVRLQKADAQALPFDDGHFETVVCINVFLCLPSKMVAEAVLKEISRVCQPGGRLILEFRNKCNLFLRLKYKLAKYYDATVKSHPFSLYTKDEVLGLLKDSGFRLMSERDLDFPIKSLAPIIILEVQKDA